MSKQLIGVFVAIVVVGGGLFIYSNSNKTENNTVDNAMMEDGSTVSTETKSSDGKKMAFESFIKNGGSYVCTVNQYVQNIESKGIVYIDGSKISGEFKTSVQGMNIGTSFISKDGYSYTWSSVMPNTGYKVAVTSSTNAGDSSTGTSGTYGFNAQDIGDYDCQAWTPDASKFDLPSSVKFTEIKR